jgi:cytochrome c553
MPCRLLLVALFLASPAVAADPAAVEHFEKKVRPLFLSHCAKCHDDAKAKGGLKMTSRAAVLAGGDTGPSVVPGKPAESLLLKAVRYTDEALQMPPAGQLPDADIAALEKWIAAGAEWPGAATVDPAKPKDGPLFTAAQKQFWAFQPLAVPRQPTPGPHPVDTFVQAKLADAGLKLSPPADKRTLLRRVTFDLTGLPPTPAELAAFESDTAATAFETVVDRLLASPHYGERWGRHWLDVARYADSNGMDENTAFGNAYKYRDSVVKGFNADKPFDRFVREQLAGDLLTDGDERDRLAALGFLALGPKVLAEPDKQKMLLDIADEQLDTTGKAFLGLTFGCARCHDHKFDPLPTRDYYSLLGVFTSTRTMQNLNTVAKTFEHGTGGGKTKEQADAEKQLDTLRREIRLIERDFGKVPETDKAKRKELHEKAEAKRAEVKKWEAALPKSEFYLGVEDGTAAAYGTQPRNLFVQVRGNYLTAGEEAPPVFPRILAGENQPPFVGLKPNLGDKPVSAKTRFGQLRDRSGRLELANWIADPTNPLTARVFVNRVWRYHFGEGLVRTPDNFGRLGDRPTHPELLDWLASEFASNGWSVKRLHKLILFSKTYQQAGGTPPATDVENKLLSCFPRRRLEAEAIRDAMLATAGTLDRTVGGTLYSGANLDYVREVQYDTRRRSLYLPVIRGKLFDFFQTFDFPDPCVTVGHRTATTVAPQALFLMNNPFVTARAAEFAGRITGGETTDAERVTFAYRQAYCRAPTADEVTRTSAFVAAYATSLRATETDDGKRTTAAWAAVAQALFASSEFAFVE